jgi:hypothetical protein
MCACELKRPGIVYAVCVTQAFLAAGSTPCSSLCRLPTGSCAGHAAFADVCAGTGRYVPPYDAGAISPGSPSGTCV